MAVSTSGSWRQISVVSSLLPPWQSSGSHPVKLTKSLGTQDIDTSTYREIILVSVFELDASSDDGSEI